MKNRNGPLGPSIIIVLGAGMDAAGTPFLRTQVRAKAAAHLALLNPSFTVITTGDGRTNRRSRGSAHTEAAAMSRILQLQGVARNRILLETQARDTVGNAVLTAARYLIGQRPRDVYVVTSPFHADRALVMFRGVLGPAWNVQAYLSETIDGDLAKGANESGGISWGERFFEGTVPGDISSSVERLLQCGKVSYRRMRWLKGLSKAA